jgi:hypothetical protein
MFSESAVLAQVRARLMVLVQEGFPPAPGAPRILVPVIPWYETCVPHFSILAALLLARRGQVKPVFIVQDLPWPADAGYRLAELAALAPLLGALASHWPVHRLSDHQPGAVIDTAILEAAVKWDVRHWLGRGAVTPEGVEGQSQLCRTAGEAIMRRLSPLLSLPGVDRILVPGGVVNGSLIYRRMAVAAGLRTFCYDAGPGLIVTGTEGPGGHHSDLVPLFERVVEDWPQAHDGMVSEAQALLADRERGQDRIIRIPFQADRDTLAGDIVFFLSREHDSNWLDRDCLFDTQSEWLCWTIPRLLAARPDLRITVRGHPRGRLYPCRLSDRALTDLTTLLPTDSRVRIIAKDEDISSYDLMRRARLVTAGPSTTCLEAAMMGRPVISTHVSSFTQAAGIAVRPVDRDTYLAMLSRPEAPPPVDPHRAALMYWLLERTSRLLTRCNPIPDDLAAWTDRPIPEWLSDPAALYLITMLETGRSIQEQRAIDALPPLMAGPGPGPA